MQKDKDMKRVNAELKLNIQEIQDNMNLKLKEVEDLIANHKIELITLEGDQRSKIEATRNDLIQTHRENCRHLERSHAEEMERQSVWHTEESNRIRSDLELLRHKYSELRKRFDARESRPEDTRRIHDLKKLLKKQQLGVD